MHVAGVVFRAVGVLDVAQLFPSGVGDADTLRVRVARDGFRVVESDRERKTRAFDDASVVGRGAHRVLDASGCMQVRLEGLDAPELHYVPTAEKVFGAGRAFRQPMGESSAVALARFLTATGSNTEIACEIDTRVRVPGDVFDAYGRCVGQLFVRRGRDRINVNDWLLNSGWALPSLFASLDRDEVDRFVAASESASRAKRGVWARYTAKLAGFSWARVFRRVATRTPASDTGLVSHPAIFRRLAAWSCSRHAGEFRGSFGEYLRSPAGLDYAHRRAEFVIDGAAAAPLHPLGTFIARNALSVAPTDIVFREAPSHVVDRRGREVTKW